MRHEIDFEGVTSRDFVCNSARGDFYISSIQNRTTQIITVTATNMDVQNPDEPAIYDGLPAPTTIAPTDFAAVDTPFVALRLSIPLAGAAGEKAYIVEAG